MTDVSDVPFTIEYRVAVELERKKIRDACRKFHAKSDRCDRIGTIVLTGPGEAEINCLCGIKRTARSRPPGRTGGLAGQLKQFWGEHLRTCSYGTAPNERAVDDLGRKLFYPSDFPEGAKEDVLLLATPEYEGGGGVRIDPYVFEDLFSGHVPVCTHADSVTPEDIAETGRERTEQLRTAYYILRSELKKLRPSRPTQPEDDSVVMRQLHEALESMRREAGATCYKVYIEHALGSHYNATHHFIIAFEEMYRWDYMWNGEKGFPCNSKARAFEKTITAYLRNQLKALTKVSKS
jgi:hypothetical protein